MNIRTSRVDVTYSLDSDDFAFVDSMAIAEADAGRFATDEQVIATFAKLGA